SEQFQLIITDISGKTIGAQKLVSGKNTIDIETLSSGLYTFTIVNAEFQNISKILIIND
ncbi:MAG: T9SS type A sorting domain-containing protein, partial [Bacteroidia bacterium]|nr:T9SS type A sorting domain-containing protein [Bacteroidia bacterium]